MQTIFIITGHGEYASGIGSALTLLMGENEKLHFVDFQIQDNDRTLQEKYKKIIDNRGNDTILFICDILGGTPFKVAAELSFKYDNIEVVAGANIGGILEVLCNNDISNVTEIADDLAISSKKAIYHFIADETFQQEPVKDGI